HREIYGTTVHSHRGTGFHTCGAKSKRFEVGRKSCGGAVAHTSAPHLLFPYMDHAIEKCAAGKDYRAGPYFLSHLGADTHHLAFLCNNSCYHILPEVHAPGFFKHTPPHLAE